MPIDADAVPRTPVAAHDREAMPARERPSRARAWRGRFARVPRWLWVVLGVLAIVLLWLAWALPLNRALAPLPEPTLVLLDRNGDAFARRGALKEAPVDARRLPKHVID